jgi:hypothetical protein
VKSAKKKKLPIHSGRRQMKFPQVKGKTLEEVDFSTDSEDHSITLVFRDKTALRFDIEPGFTMFADYANWKTGDVQVIRRWPGVRSRLFRE